MRVQPIRAGFDTEGTGLNLFHSDRPFMCCFTFSQAMPELNGRNQVSWEWPVDPLTRTPIYDPNDLVEIVWWLRRTDITWYLHNAKYDTRAIAKAIEDVLLKLEALPSELYDTETVRYYLAALDLDPYEYLDRANDTALMAHAYDNRGTHKLKDLGVKFLNIPEDDVESLKAQVEACVPLAERLGWKIASATNCPLVQKKPDGGWWVMDMWLPHAVWNYIQSLPGGQTPKDISDLYYLLWNPVDETFKNYCKAYCLTDTVRTLHLGDFLYEQLVNENLTDAYKLNQQQLPVAYQMEETGLNFLINKADEEQRRLRDLAAKFDKKCKYLIRDNSINLNAPAQVAQALMLRYSVDVERKTKNNDYTIDKDEVEELYAKTEAAVMVGESDKMDLLHFLFSYMGFKKCTKVADQDIPRYKRQAIREVDYYNDGQPVYRWVIHFDFNIGGTDTTRYSSNGSQNIGKGKNAFNEAIKALDLSLRKLFGPSIGYKWLTGDGKQLQIVIGAYTSKEPLLMAAVERGDDLHTTTQLRLCEVLNIVYNAEDDGQRTIAKNCNFGYLFGAGEEKIDTTAHTPGLYTLLTNAFPEARKTIRRDIKFVKDNGFIMAGPYRLYTPSDAPYAATVYKIQGLEGVIIKRAMRSMYNFARANPLLRIRICLMVHDEIVIQLPVNSDTSIVKWLIYFIEEAGAHYGIRCRADAKEILTNWKDGKKVS